MKHRFGSLFTAVFIAILTSGCVGPSASHTRLEATTPTTEPPPTSPYDLTSLSETQLCILSAEHSSNIQPVASELKRRRASRSACNGISALRNYNGLSRSWYLRAKQKDLRNYTLVSSKENVSTAESAELCVARKSSFSGVSEDINLTEELNKRQLSPADCDFMISERQASLCAVINEIDNSMTFAKIEEKNRENIAVLEELYFYDATSDTCKILQSKNQSSQPRGRFSEEIFNIDRLQIRTLVDSDDPTCSSGSVGKIYLSGVIGPDSSFAMETLLQRMPPCRNEADEITRPVVVSLHSGGGLLEHGYELGKTLRALETSTLIESENICASSCAVAFLGGKTRIIEDEGSILLHAPYFAGKNEYGARDVNCKVGDEALKKLESYYKEMTDAQTGARLFDRTLWYCSSDDGWVITGGAAAELFGIATER